MKNKLTPVMEKQIEEFETIGFGNQVRIPGGKYGAKRIELINYLIHSMQKAYDEGRKIERRIIEKGVSHLVTKYPELKTSISSLLYHNSLIKEKK